MFDATDFLATEVSSEQIEKELRKWSTMYSWIDENNSKTYFELSMSATPEFLSPVALIVSKTYIRDLVIMSIFHENSIYFMIQSGEGDQPLLDVRFPDVSKHGQGLQLACYTGSSFSMEAYADEREEKGEILSDVSESKDGSVQDSAASLKNAWKKLTLWHILDKTGEVHNTEAKAIVQAPKLKTFSISSGDYQQTC